MWGGEDVRMWGGGEDMGREKEKMERRRIRSKRVLYVG